MSSAPVGETAREGNPPPRRGRLARGLLLLIGAPAIALAWVWVAGSLVFFETWSIPVGLGVASAWAALPLLAAWRLGLRRTLAGCSLFALAWLFVFLTVQRPRTDREWAPDQAFTVSLNFEADGRHVVVDQVRASLARDAEDREVHWESRRYDLETVCCVDFVIEPLPALPGMAHALLSFGFDDGRHLAISAEIRREVGESYSPVAGLFRRYELVYVVGDERDLLGLRLDARAHELRIHPLRVERERAASLLRSMLRRAEALGRDPEFYDSFGKNCTTSLVAHLEELRGEALPFAWQVHLPLHADEVAWELGLIEGASSLSEARVQNRVVGPSPAADSDGVSFSRWLRRGR